MTLARGLDARRLTRRNRSASRPASSSATSASSRSGWCCRTVLAARRRPAWLVSLVKPQFEVGRENLVKGAVKDPERAPAGLRGGARCVEALGWTSLGLIPSPVLGGDGAREFLYAARHG